ncbi:MAG TPA: Spy/CpxP family protein refolding chaperone [Polyangiaceae bacterium]|nr:Spy/CpxP family protein refolding chaperone [Polyangiaceae bacterium]
MFKRSLLALSLALAVPALGCGGSVTSEPPQTADTATTKAPVAVNAHGPVKLFGEALGDVPLTAAQRTQIEQLATDAEARHADARAARKDLMTVLATQVQAGQIDRTALQPKIDALTAAMQKAQPGDRAAFEQLHAILDPQQRTEFVDAVKAHIGEHKGEKHDRHASMKQWAADLQLSDDQKAQIKSAIMDHMHAAGAAGGGHDWSQAKHQGQDVMAAFAQDRFVMNEVAPPRDVQAQVAKMTGHMLGLVEAALPVLTPQQRVLAAQKLVERADSIELQ